MKINMNTNFAQRMSISKRTAKLVMKKTLLAAIPFYLLSPFRINLIFTRQGPGEAMAQVLIPLSLLFLEQKGKTGLVALTATLAVLSLTHNLTYIFVSGMLLFWALAIRREAEILKTSMAAIALSLLLTAYFWLPALLERELTHYHETARQWYQEQFPTLRALLDSPWQYGPPQPERQALSMSFQIGKMHWLILAATPIFWLKRKTYTQSQKRVIAGLVLLFAFSILFQLKVTKPVWDGLDPLKIFIFPWRLQAISVFAIALLTPFLIAKLPLPRVAVIVIVILLLLANRNHLFAARGDYAADDYIKAMGHDGGSSGEFLPIWANLEEYRGFRNASLPPPSGILQEQAGVQLLKSTKTEVAIELEIEAVKERQLALNHYYFPGWKGWLDGQPVTLSDSLTQTNGRMTVTVPPGRHQIALRFEKTLVRRLATLLSVVTLIVTLMWLGIVRKKEAI